MGRRYTVGGPWVLRAVDLDLPAAALIRIEGTNGTGKSTLLRLIAGIDAPTEGGITGRPRTAYVPERFPAALPFTAAGYLAHLGRVHGLPGRSWTRWGTRPPRRGRPGCTSRRLSAMGRAALLGVVGTAYVAAVRDPESGDHQVAVPRARRSDRRRSLRAQRATPVSPPPYAD